MSTAMWKLEKDLCRCCHAEGSFKHLSDPCFQLGQEEIYSDMLQDCLDIKIVPITGVLSDVTYTICESCVARLRDAANFKRQVQDCEERFKDMYSKNLIKCAGSISPDYEVKEEPMVFESDTDMKQEYQSIGDEDEDDDDAFMKFDDDDDSLDLEEREELITVQIKGEPKGKGKGKAKPKPKPKETPVKKPKATKEKPLKVEELTEAAVSGEKKKGVNNNFTLTLEDDGSRTYICDECGNGFKKRSHFSQHYRHVHLKLRPKLRSCCLCNLKVPAHMRAFHLESVHGWPAPSCGVCGKKFAYPFQVLRHHKIDHMGEKSYTCETCNMKFSSKYRLGQHAIKHTGLRKYKCTFCGKTFRWKNNLKTHVMIHLDEKSHVCPLCAEAFVQQSSLRYHLLKKHPDKVNKERLTTYERPDK